MKNRIPALMLAAAVLLAGCGQQGNVPAPVQGPEAPASAGTSGGVRVSGQWDAASAAQIGLDGGFQTNNTAGVSVNGNVLTIAKGGTYVFSGTLENGQIVVDAKDAEVQIVLNGVSLSCAQSAPIYGKDGKITVTLAEGTENTLADGTAYAFPNGGDEPSGALFSKDDLTIGGSGALTVKGQYQHGIITKDDLVIDGGTLTVEAKSDGIRGRDSVTVNGGSITIAAEGDGIQSNNNEDAEKGTVSLLGGTFDITAGSDAIQAETRLEISGGDYNLVTGGGSGDGHYEGETSCKGLKAGTAISVSGGTFTLDTLDDAIHSNGTVDITDGTFTISTGDDAVHGEGAVTVDGGSLDIAKCYEGLEGLSVTMAAGTVHITASDDGVNAADPTAQEGPGGAMLGGRGGMRGGQPPEMAGTNGTEPSEALEVSSGASDGTPGQSGSAAGTASGAPADAGASGSPAKDAAAPPEPPAGMQDGGQPPMGMGGPGGRSSNPDVFIRVSGGTLVVDAKGDALDANGSIYLEGGTVLLNGPTSSGDGALDYDGECTVTGGTFIAAGSAGMAQVPQDASSQPTLMIYFTEKQAAGTAVNLSKQDGSSIVTFAPAKEFQTIVISTPELKDGETVVLSTGGGADLDADGFAAAESWSGGTKLAEITLSGMVTAVSDDGSETTGRGMGGPGMGGGRGGGRMARQTDPAQANTQAQS